MKKTLIILMFVVSTSLSAQDKIDRLSDKVDRIAEQQAITNTKVDKLTEQMIETNKQMRETNKLVAVNSADINNLDKYFDMLLYIASVCGGVFFVGIIMLFRLILWDRKLANTPLQITTAELRKDIDLLKQQGEKRNVLLRKILEKFPDLAPDLARLA